jgi:hypothetical protein
MGYMSELLMQDPNEDFVVVTIFDGMEPAAPQTHLCVRYCECGGCQQAFRAYFAPWCYGEQPNPTGTVMPGPVVC